LLQERLQELGYPVSATGYFGTETQSAVEYFQRMNGLDDDGSVGQDTKEYLFSDNAEPSLEYYEALDAGEGSGSGGGSSSGGSSGGSHAADPGNVDAFIAAAQAQLGKPYVRGGKGPDSFDCSGLVYYALKASGNGIGYMTSGGWAGSGYTTIGSIGELQPGDVICFTGHVGVYIGGGVMVDASSSNGQVVQRGLGNWAYSNFICGKRPL
jgi:cell wall-associated NlpC family hydrolase